MRVIEILKFHETVTQVNIALAVEIYEARKLRNGDMRNKLQTTRSG